MLGYHRLALDVFTANRSCLAVFERGLDTFCLLREFVVAACLNHERVFVFNVTEHDKQRLAWEVANAGADVLPLDIERATLRRDRAQHYGSRLAIFHSAGILAKDVISKLISPADVEGLVVMDAGSVLRDPGLRTCLALLRGCGTLRCLSEHISGFRDLQRTVDALGVERTMLMPRFEEHVREALSSFELQEIPVRIAEDGALLRLWHLLGHLLQNFVADQSERLGVTLEEASTFHPKSLANRVTDEEGREQMGTLLFIRRARDLLLHADAETFEASFDPSRLRQYPEAEAVRQVARQRVREGFPAPKLTRLKGLLDSLPDRRVLVLAAGAATVTMICRFLSGFQPPTAAEAVPGLEVPEADGEWLVDPRVVGVMDNFVMVQDLRAEADVLDTMRPDAVVLWDASVLVLRRLEVFSARYGGGLAVYVLNYVEADELAATARAAERERDAFIAAIQRMKRLVPAPQVRFALTRRIIVDEREFRSPQPLGLLRAGFELVPAVIAVGDYVLSDDFAIERKAYSDLVGSLNSGRLLAQLQRMRGAYAHFGLLLEFDEVTSPRFNQISARGGPLGKVVAILRHFPKLRLIWARNCDEAGLTLWSLAQGMLEPALAHAQAAAAAENETSPGARLLAAIPFLPAPAATALAGVGSLRKLAGMRRDELAGLVDPAVAAKMFALFNAPGTEPPK